MDSHSIKESYSIAPTDDDDDVADFNDDDDLSRFISVIGRLGSPVDSSFEGNAIEKTSEVSLCQKATRQCNDSVKIEWHVNCNKSPCVPTQSGHAQ